MTDIRASQLSTTSNLGISARSDPAGLARQIANDSRVGGRIDVDLARAKADQLAAKNPELAASIRQELESQMTPVERGQLAAAYDTPAKTQLNQSQGTLIAATPNCAKNRSYIGQSGVRSRLVTLAPCFLAISSAHCSRKTSKIVTASLTAPDLKI